MDRATSESGQKWPDSIAFSHGGINLTPEKQAIYMKIKVKPGCGWGDSGVGITNNGLNSGVAIIYRSVFSCRAAARFGVAQRMAACRCGQKVKSPLALALRQKRPESRV